jgi:predicted CXXCH cytochrome family protein
MPARPPSGKLSAASRRPAGAVAFGMVMAMLMAGCTADPIDRHKMLTTFFDGVPALPPVQELCLNQMEALCEEYNQADITDGMTEEGAAGKRLGSQHRPYAEKNCEGCHDFQAANLLIRPNNQLCFVCHTNFITGSFVHGPVSVGDCLACHFPHDSRYTALLRESKSAICSKCHREERLAAKMHEQVIAHGMECVSCHDPHSGNAQYFLK